MPQVCQLLEGIACLCFALFHGLAVADRPGHHSSQLFCLRTLYPLLEKVADPHATVADAARVALTQIAAVLGHRADEALDAVGALLVHNSDYVVDEVLRRMRFMHLHPHTPRVFCALLRATATSRAAGPRHVRITSLIQSTLTTIMRTLDDHRADRKMVHQHLKMLEGIVAVLAPTVRQETAGAHARHREEEAERARRAQQYAAFQATPPGDGPASMEEIEAFFKAHAAEKKAAAQRQTMMGPEAGEPCLGEGEEEEEGGGVYPPAEPKPSTDKRMLLDVLQKVQHFVLTTAPASGVLLLSVCQKGLVPFVASDLWYPEYTAATDRWLAAAGAPDPPAPSAGAPDPPTASAGAPDPPTASVGAPDPPTASAGAPDPPAPSAGAPDPPTASAGAPDPPTASAGAPDPPAPSAGAPDPPTASAGAPDTLTPSAALPSPFHDRDVYPCLHKAWAPLLQALLPSGYNQFDAIARAMPPDTAALGFAMNLKGPDGYRRLARLPEPPLSAAVVAVLEHCGFLLFYFREFLEHRMRTELWPVLRYHLYMTVDFSHPGHRHAGVPYVASTLAHKLQCAVLRLLWLLLRPYTAADAAAAAAGPDPADRRREDLRRFCRSVWRSVCHYARGPRQPPALRRWGGALGHKLRELVPDIAAAA